jgi:hypothetical protein
MSIVLQSTGGGSVTINEPTTASNFTQTLPAVTGNALVSTAVSASILGTVTNKIAINIDGTVYYLLANTSGT